MPVIVLRTLPVGVILLALIGTLPACLRTPLPAPVDFSVQGADSAALRDRVIVLDPGHGGPERGALGPRGMTEAEVNLGVALYLRALLEAAGARVVLTRQEDAPVQSGTPFCLQADLQARAQAAGAHSADLFVSIHHNASENTGANDLIVFYKMADQGPSRDAARDVADGLQAALSTGSAHVLPANYHVLRAAATPAVLGEASFMTHRKNASRLAFHRTLSREAAGYFEGIRRYFARGVPVITAMQPRNTTIQDARPLITARLQPGTPGGAIDPGSIIASLDGHLVETRLDRTGTTVTCRPRQDLANSDHRFCIAVRNTAGNSSPTCCTSFQVALPPAELCMAPVFPTIPADGMSVCPLDITIRDMLGRPVADSTTVTIAATGGSLLADTLVTRDGSARALLASGNRPAAVTVTATSGPAAAQATVSFGPPTEALLVATIRDHTGEPLVGAGLFREGRWCSRSDERGFVYDQAPPGDARYSVYQRGFLPQTFSVSLVRGESRTENLLVEPVSGGVFHNRRVMLDPAGEEPRVLALLQALRHLIDFAGGEVGLTWQTAPPPAAQVRVSAAARMRADVFLSISGGTQVRAGYYYKSTAGRSLARLLTGALEGNDLTPTGSSRRSPANDYVIVHTPMPAVTLQVHEPVLDRPQEAAVAISRGLAAYFAREEKGP